MMGIQLRLAEAYSRDDEALMRGARALSERGAQMMERIESGIAAGKDYDALLLLVKKGRRDCEGLQLALDARAAAGAGTPPMLTQNQARIANALRQSSLLLDANRQRFLYFSRRQQRMSRLA